VPLGASLGKVLDPLGDYFRRVFGLSCALKTPNQKCLFQSMGAGGASGSAGSIWNRSETDLSFRSDIEDPYSQAV